MVKNLPGSAGGKKDMDSFIHSPGNPLQYSCQENPMDREAWPAIVHRVAKSRTGLKQLACKHACILSSVSNFIMDNHKNI